MDGIQEEEASNNRFKIVLNALGLFCSKWPSSKTLFITICSASLYIVIKSIFRVVMQYR